MVMNEERILNHEKHMNVNESKAMENVHVQFIHAYTVYRTENYKTKTN